MVQPTAHHVGITVSDLDRMVAFYEDVLGLDVASRFEVAGENFAAAVGVDGASARFAHLEGDGCRIELVAYDPGGEPRDGSTLDRPGASHLGLAVEDVDAIVDDLPADVPRLSDPRTTATGTRICFLRDPEGNLVELLAFDAA